MKKIKLIPALLLTVILSGCEFKIVVKEPSFASKGRNIDQDTFRSGITLAYNENEYFKADLNLSSRELQFKETIVEKQNRAKNKKVYYSDEYTSSTEGYLRYDSEDLLLEQERYVKETRVVEGDQVDSKTNKKNHYKTFMEYGSGEFENKVVSLDQMLNEVQVVAEASDAEAAKKTLDTAIANQFVTLFNSSKMMHYAESGDTHLYKFYKNGDRYTVVYKETYETYEAAMIDGVSKDVKKYYTIRESKSQVDLTKGAETITISDKTDTTCEVLLDHSGYKKGEIVDVENIRYVVCTSKDAQIDLNRIDDYSSYFLKN